MSLLHIINAFLIVLQFLKQSQADLNEQICEELTGSHNQAQFQNTHTGPNQQSLCLLKDTILNCCLWYVFKNNGWEEISSFSFLFYFVLM